MPSLQTLSFGVVRSLIVKVNTESKKDEKHTMQILWLAVVPLALTATALGGSMEKRPARQDIAILRRATESLSSTTKRKNIGGAGAASLRIQPLPYPTDALEPAISKAIMELHHDKHLQGYITAYNEAVGKHAAVGSSDLGAQLALAKVRMRPAEEGHWVYSSLCPAHLWPMLSLHHARH